MVSLVLLVLAMAMDTVLRTLGASQSTALPMSGSGIGASVARGLDAQKAIGIGLVVARRAL